MYYLISPWFIFSTVMMRRFEAGSESGSGAGSQDGPTVSGDKILGDSSRGGCCSLSSIVSRDVRVY